MTPVTSVSIRRVADQAWERTRHRTEAIWRDGGTSTVGARERPVAMIPSTGTKCPECGYKKHAQAQRCHDCYNGNRKGLRQPLARASA